MQVPVLAPLSCITAPVGATCTDSCQAIRSRLKLPPWPAGHAPPPPDTVPYMDTSLVAVIWCKLPPVVMGTKVNIVQREIEFVMSAVHALSVGRVGWCKPQRVVTGVRGRM